MQDKVTESVINGETASYKLYVSSIGLFSSSVKLSGFMDY